MALSKYVMQPTPGADIRRYASAELQKIEKSIGSIIVDSTDIRSALEAAQADLLALDARLDALEATLTWITPTLLNGWLDFDADRSCQYSKDALGIVRVRGLVKSGTIGNTIFQLPVGFRPALNRNMGWATVSSNGAEIASRVNVVNGLVQAATGGNVYFFLDGIAFKAEA